MTAKTAHEKAHLLQKILPDKLDHYLPEKNVKFTSEDQVWMTSELKEISRKKRREYFKHHKSEKWKTLNDLFEKSLIIKTLRVVSGTQNSSG